MALKNFRLKPESLWQRISKSSCCFCENCLVLVNFRGYTTLKNRKMPKASKFPTLYKLRGFLLTESRIIYRMCI